MVTEVIELIIVVCLDGTRELSIDFFSVDHQIFCCLVHQLTWMFKDLCGLNQLCKVNLGLFASRHECGNQPDGSAEFFKSLSHPFERLSLEVVDGADDLVL